MAKNNFLKRLFIVVIPFLLFFTLFSYIWNYVTTDKFVIILSNNPYDIPLRFILPLVNMYPDTYFLMSAVSVYGIWFLHLILVFLLTFITSRLLNKHLDAVGVAVVRFRMIFVSAVVMVFFFMSFQLGLHWQGILADNLSLSKLTNMKCYGHNNWEETYQLSCFSPTQQFSYKKDLDCRTLINHQMSNSGPGNISNEFITIKADYMSFRLHINKESIDKPPTPGEFDKPAFRIVYEDSSVVQAVRNASIDGFFGDVYEYISISKKSGKGVITWFNSTGYSHDGDSMATEYFQCK